MKKQFEISIQASYLKVFLQLLKKKFDAILQKSFIFIGETAFRYLNSVWFYVGKA
jgi:hypothetical protein